MRRLLSICGVLSIAALLTGCGVQTPPVSQTDSPAAVTTASTSAPIPSQEDVVTTVLSNTAETVSTTAVENMTVTTIKDTAVTVTTVTAQTTASTTTTAPTAEPEVDFSEFE